MAKQLGLTVEEMKIKMSAEEYSNWIAFYRKNPPGDHYTHLLLGQLICMLAAALGEKKLKLEDVVGWISFKGKKAPIEIDKKKRQSAVHSALAEIAKKGI